MRHWLPVFPGSLTTVASINRSVETDPDSATRPRSSNSAQQSRYSQSLLLRSRLRRATSESSASLACRALTTVSRMEKPHPRCSKSVRKQFSALLSRRNPFSALVTCPSSCQFGGKKEIRSFQSSLAALAVVMHPTVSESGRDCNKQVSAYGALPQAGIVRTLGPEATSHEQAT